ncbi:MFS general substrate transporter, partial [Acaromyces ingoldii]
TPTAAKKAQLSPIFTVLAAGSALVSDGYQNNVMSLLNTLFAKRYGSKVYTSDVSTRVSNSLTVGTILGQVIVGVVCDRIGRKAAIVIASVLLCIGAIFATGAAPIHGSTNALFWWLTVARGCIGVGVGAEYPASSSSASEAASERYSRKTRSTVFILCTNLVLSLGGPIASSYFLIILSATSYTGEQSPEQNARKLDIIWRLCFGFGALLPLSVFYFRIKMLTTKLYAESAIKHNVPYWLAVKRYWPRLIGTLGAWFLYDFVAFANSAFSSTVIATVVDNPTLKRTAEYQLLLGAIALPGAILGAYAVRYLGSKWLLIAGFTGYIIIGLIVGLAWDHIIKIPALFVVLYGLLASFGNFGPGSVMGLVSSDCYPTALRGTFYGLSAAVGKVGGVVGTEVFKPVQAHGKKYTFIVAACCGVVGVLLAFFFVPDTTRFDLAEQDKEWEQYLVRNGWDHVVGE